MLFAEFPKMGRFSRDVIVTEKIDGTNAQIYIEDKRLVLKMFIENPEIPFIFINDGDTEYVMLAGSRNKWVSPGSDNYAFAKWVSDNRDELLGLGVGRHFGEWWGSGIQRGYGLQKGQRKFSLFNVHRWNNDTRPAICDVVPTLWTGNMDDLDAFKIMTALKEQGSAAAPGFMDPEGIVIFHTAANIGFKKTFSKDDTGKWDNNG